MSENKIGLSKASYKGSPSTLCVGCGHDSITNHLVSALYESNTPPHLITKISGIGCSSKTTNYFVDSAHGFNAIHGRMAPVATGAKLVNKDLRIIGISGDGDSASIGLGGFVHLLRRNLPMVYVVENNGVYGLTKGQFSATADEGSTVKSGSKSYFQSIDLCMLAMTSGCSFVARAFSGDKKQLLPLLKAALSHNGTAFIDIVSPCVTFANHEGSTKSFNYAKEHKHSLQEFGYVPANEEITADYKPGDSQMIQMHDGSKIMLKKIDGKSYDPQDFNVAIQEVKKSQDEKSILTGLLYHKNNQENLLSVEKVNSQVPLVKLEEKELKPTANHLKDILQKFK